MPEAEDKYSRFFREHNIDIEAIETAAFSGVGGPADHGNLSGLTDDDHPQYHNDTRADIRYYTKSQVDAFLSGKENSGTASNAIADHIAELDPHTQYATETDLSALETRVDALEAGPVSLADDTTITTDVSQGNHFRVTLGGNRTLGNPINPTDGQRVIWEFIQDGTGSRTITLGSNFALGSDITSVVLTTTANKRDFMGAIYNSTTGKWFVIAFTRGY